MSAEAILEAVHVLNPRTLGRARRLTVALELVRAGNSRSRVVALLKLRFSIGRHDAWRLMCIAADMAGQPKENKK